MGRPRSIVPAGAGQKSRLGVLRLETSDGSFAVKRFDERPRPGALAIEDTAYEAGFPMPRPHRTAGGVPYAMYGHAGRPLWVRVCSWVPGAAYDWGVVDPTLSRQVGRLLAALHAVPVPPEALEQEAWKPLGASGWARLLAHATTKGVAWAPMLAARIPSLVEWEDHVLAYTVTDEPRVPSQRDLHPPNLVRSTDGRHVVVDWDAAGPVNAREEAAKFALVWATRPGRPPSREAVQAFIGGYREAGGHFVARGVLDLTHRARSLLSWVAFNVGRDVSEHPGPDPDLTPALLAEVGPRRRDALERDAALLR